MLAFVNQKSISAGHFAGHIGRCSQNIDMDSCHVRLIHVHSAGAAQAFQKNGKLAGAVQAGDFTASQLVQDAVGLSVINTCHIRCNESCFSCTVIGGFHILFHPDVAMLTCTNADIGLLGIGWSHVFFLTNGVGSCWLQSDRGIRTASLHQIRGLARVCSSQALGRRAGASIYAT